MRRAKREKRDIVSLPMEERALMALREAVEGVIQEHERLQIPLHVWRDGRVAAVPAKEIRNGRVRNGTGRKK